MYILWSYKNEIKITWDQYNMNINKGSHCDNIEMRRNYIITSVLPVSNYIQTFRIIVHCKNVEEYE